MSLHRHVRPFLMPQRCRHLANSHTFDQNRHDTTMGRTVTFSKCTRVTFGQAGSEESAHLRHMRCTDNAGIHRSVLVRRRRTEGAIFLHCCIGDYRRRQRLLPKCANVYSVERPRASWQVANGPQSASMPCPQLTMDR